MLTDQQHRALAEQGVLLANFHVPLGPLPVAMAHSDGAALPLLKAGAFAADLIRFPPAGGVPEHTHPGAHMLFVVGGVGSLLTAGVRLDLRPGVCYLAPAGVPHSIHASARRHLSLVSVANDHRDAGSASRLNLT